jgi:hypothetical protein
VPFFSGTVNGTAYAGDTKALAINGGKQSFMECIQTDGVHSGVGIEQYFVRNRIGACMDH